MNKSTFSAVLLAACLCANIGSAEDHGNLHPRYLGPVAGNSEKDTFGYGASERGAQRVVPTVLSDAPSYVGDRAGDEEKDTFGHVLLRSQAAASLLHEQDR